MDINPEILERLKDPKVPKEDKLAVPPYPPLLTCP